MMGVPQAAPRPGAAQAQPATPAGAKIDTIQVSALPSNARVAAYVGEVAGGAEASFGDVLDTSMMLTLD